MPKKNEKVQIEAWFTGKVQGVGFRYETLTLAKGYAVTGFVENLADGRVHLIVCGISPEPQDFVRTLQENMSDYIRETEERAMDSVDAFTSFSIRR